MLDRAHTLVRAVLAAWPVGGGPAVEILGVIVGPPLERRRQAWMERVAAGLRDLDGRVGAVFDDLENNEAFQSAFLHATQAALRTHQDEKLRALRNAVLNSAFSQALDLEMELVFVRFLDELTPSHLVLLRRFSERESEIQDATSYQTLFETLCASGDGLALSTEEFKLLCSDLQNRVLLRISPSVDDFPDVHHWDIVVNEPQVQAPRVRVTDLGKRFLAFVSEPSVLAT
jgi:hypothetical protein